MTEDLYAKPDLTKKVRFQTEEEEDKNADVYEDISNSTIYDNYCPKGTTPPKSQDNTTDDQQQSIQLSVSTSGKNPLKPAAVLLGLLCLLLLGVVIVLLVLVVQDNSYWNMELNRLSVLNAKLTSERDNLQTSLYELKNINYKLIQKAENEENLKLIHDNLTSTIHALQRQIERTHCPAKWIKFDYSCYLISTSMKNWIDSKEACEKNNAQLVIISTIMEQAFIKSLNLQTWIGLSDEESENKWKWVNGTAVTTTYWMENQPDNRASNNQAENCVAMKMNKPVLKSWNVKTCDSSLNFICERILQ